MDGGTADHAAPEVVAGAGDDRVALRIMFGDRTSMVVQVGRQQPLAALAAHVAAHVHAAPASVVLKFEGAPVADDETADVLDLQPQDQLEALLRP